MLCLFVCFIFIISLPLSSENGGITKDVGGRQVGPFTRRGPLTAAHFRFSLQHRELRGATPGWMLQAGGQEIGRPKQKPEMVRATW